jgi:hypothetical protein
VRDPQAGRSRRAQAVDARGTSNAALGGAKNGQSQPMDTGGSRVEGGTGRWWRWRTRMPGSCGPYGVGAASMVKARATAASTRGGSTGLRRQQAKCVVKSFPRKKAGQGQGRGKRQEVEVACRTLRGVIEVLTREVRPASPEPVNVKGL